MALVTLTSFKEYSNISSVTHDDIYAQLITKISEAINSFVKVPIEQASYKQIYDGPGEYELMLDKFPIISVGVLSQSLNFDTKKYTDKLTIADDILIHNKSGIIELVNTVFNVAKRSVYIEYVAGYAAVSIPEDLQMVCNDWIIKKSQDIINLRMGLSVKNVMSENVSYIFRDLNTEHKQIINSYKKLDRSSNGRDVTGWGEL